MVRIGDKQYDIAGQIATLAQDIEEVYQPEEIIDQFFKCIVCLPTKTFIYARVVGLLHERNVPVVRDIIERLQEDLMIAVQVLELGSIKLLVRFVCELSLIGVLKFEAVFEVFEALLAFGIVLWFC